MVTKMHKSTGTFSIPDTWSVWGYEFHRMDYEQHIILMHENNKEYMRVEGRIAQLNALCTSLGYSYTIHRPEKRELFINNSRAGFEYQAYITISKRNTDGTLTLVASAPGTSVEFWDSSEINFNYAEENAETSAIGRALCFLGFNTGGIDTYERMNRAVTSSASHKNNKPENSYVYNQAIQNNNIAPILARIEEKKSELGMESYINSINSLGIREDLVSTDLRMATALLKDLINKSKIVASQ